MKMYFNLGTAGASLYAVVFNDAGQAWKPATSSFVTYTTTRDDFDVNLPEIGTTGYYGPVSLPGTGPGRVWYIYKQIGGSPSHTNDVLLGEFSESIDANVVQMAGDATAASSMYTQLLSTLSVASSTNSQASTISATLTTVANRIGLFTGTGVNTILGFLKALLRKDLAAPSDVGGTWNPANDSMEAHTDGEITIKEVTTAGMAKFSSVNTGETTPVTGSVAKLSQGAADPETFFDATLGVLADHPAGSFGERLLRIPNAAPAGAGGLPTVDANNRVAGVQAATNITSTGSTVLINGSGHVTTGTNADKTGYALSGSGDTSVANAVAAQSNIVQLIADAAAAKVAAQASVYYAGLSFIKDGSTDEYTIQWYKDGAPVVSGITVPTLQVIKRSDGTDLIASTTPTQIASTGAYKYDATGGQRLASGDSAVAVMTATIDSATRTWRKVIGKDIPA